MMEASPAAPFVVSKPHLLLEILVVALDPPAPLGHADEGGALVPSRQVMVFQARGFKLMAKFLAETG